MWASNGGIDAKAASAPNSPFDKDVTILAVEGKPVPLRMTEAFTRALRGLLMKECPVQPPPEWFSGHRPDGSSSLMTHIALAPLPRVGFRDADGSIAGVAIVLPVGLGQDERERCLGPFLRDTETGLPRKHRVFDGRNFDVIVTPVSVEGPPKVLRPDTWTRKSRTWGSVTPVVPNRQFDGEDMWSRTEENVREACMLIGLSPPREVLLQPVSLVEGAPPARVFPQLSRRNDGSLRSHSHAVLMFDEPVEGPVLAGAGRFRGYGLCLGLDR